MAKGAQVPRWLERRSYYRRLGRWAKLWARPQAEADALPAGAAGSNVLPFRDHQAAARRAGPKEPGPA